MQLIDMYFVLFLFLFCTCVHKCQGAFIVDFLLMILIIRLLFLSEKLLTGMIFKFIVMSALDGWHGLVEAVMVRYKFPVRWEWMIGIEL